MVEGAGQKARLRGRSGQPLIFLATVIVLWTSARVIHYLPPVGAVSGLPVAVGAGLVRRTDTSVARSAGHGGLAALGMEAHAAVPARVANLGARRRRSIVEGGVTGIETRIAHHRLWAQSLTASDGQPGRSPLLDRPLLPHQGQMAVQAATEPVMQPGGRRWSVYGWSLLRQGSEQRVLAAGGQYGGSQAGLVVRWRTGGHSGDPVLYARATGALASHEDRTLAIGAVLRPLANLPVELAAERRFGLASGQRDQFAAMIVGGGSVMHARTGIEMEGHGQAGIVGLGDPLGFFDLQMLASRRLVQQDRSTVSLGGGLWAGGQQNMQADGDTRWLHRIDIGPRATLAVPVGDARMTVALDWRQRVDGAAQPASGAALTLSTGF